MDYVKIGNTGLDVSKLCLGVWDLVLQIGGFMNGLDLKHGFH